MTLKSIPGGEGGESVGEPSRGEGGELVGEPAGTQVSHMHQLAILDGLGKRWYLNLLKRMLPLPKLRRRVQLRHQHKMTSMEMRGIVLTSPTVVFCPQRLTVLESGLRPMGSLGLGILALVLMIMDF